eukprot:TRINITY_DN34845_c0_g1_i1.p1 TRINITY_DN34845_c0_g1~~TRINITY_DN34845_c0_g1_i1.p1  ORF type:complete len:108 (+),score=7.38 TRINITY_DN34845_c0_g1_i1:377-700(+)
MVKANKQHQQTGISISRLPQRPNRTDGYLNKNPIYSPPKRRGRYCLKISLSSILVICERNFQSTQQVNRRGQKNPYFPIRKTIFHRTDQSSLNKEEIQKIHIADKGT